MSTLYDDDIVAWAREQATMLREGRFASLDLDNILEEIEDVGRSCERELAQRVSILITHLLKWRYQQKFRSNRWRAIIEAQRSKIARRVKRIPGLRSEIASDEWLLDVWGDAVDDAVSETGMCNTFPDKPIWNIEEILDPQFYPEADL